MSHTPQCHPHSVRKVLWGWLLWMGIVPGQEGWGCLTTALGGVTLLRVLNLGSCGHSSLCSSGLVGTALSQADGSWDTPGSSWGRTPFELRHLPLFLLLQRCADQLWSHNLTIYPQHLLFLFFSIESAEPWPQAQWAQQKLQGPCLKSVLKVFQREWYFGSLKKTARRLFSQF